MRCRRLVTLTSLVSALSACTSGAASGPSATPTPTTSSAATAHPSQSTPPSSTRPRTRPSSVHHGKSSAQRVFDAMTERQRVGQLLMVDCPSTGVAGATSAAITRYHVGSVILDGTSTAGVSATKRVTSSLQSLAPTSTQLFISTDQEGGLVQRLQGPGFSTIPRATVQGRMSTSALRSAAEQWGTELHEAGVNVNLAPVFDTASPAFGSNPPIAALEREYGSTPDVVATHALAYARGMADAGVDATAKHFPGLGRVHGNTDMSSGVTDTGTGREDVYLIPFSAAASADVPFVMMSTAIYSQLDPGTPAAFSKTIVTGLLRRQLHFTGLIISDDIGAAEQVSYLSPGARAVAFVAAGGDVVLTVDASQAQEMTSALLARAKSDSAFKKQVDAAALLVLRAKQQRGLLG